MTEMPPSQLGYIQNPLDRVHNQREHDGYIEAMAARDDGLAVVLAGDRPLFFAAGNPNATALFPVAEAKKLAPCSEGLFLGLEASGRPVFARQAPAIDCGDGNGPPPPGSGELPGGPRGVAHCDLRSFALAGLVPPPEIAITALARSLFAWHASHGYCSACGKPSDIILGGYRRRCPDCGALHFPRTDPVTIMLITHEDHALMARGAHFPPGMYSAIAGFMEPGETIEEAVGRETFEETGLRVGGVTYHMSQPWPFPSSLMIACFAEAAATEMTLDNKELEDARWVSRGELAAALRGEADFLVPAPIAIAHHLVRGFIEGA